MRDYCVSDDLNNDGFKDLIFSLEGDGIILCMSGRNSRPVLSNSGIKDFKSILDEIIWPQSLKIFDFDSDGFKDRCALSVKSNVIVIKSNKGLYSKDKCY